MIYTAEQPDISFPVTDGGVLTFTKDSNTIYIGGSFTYLGHNTGCGVFIDSATGELLPGFPRVEGKIMDVLPDGHGGIYVAGNFSHVGGLDRIGLAQIDSNGAVTSWNPNLNAAVRCMVMKNGLLYIGGFFSQVGGIAHSRVAAIDCITGAPTSFNPIASPYDNTSVWSISISGNRLYAGGDFTTIGGTTKQHIAAFNISTGLVTSWCPGGANLTVYKVLSANGKVYAGGTFSAIGNGSRAGLAELDSITGNPTSFNASMNTGAHIFNMIISNNIMFVDGNFTSIRGLPRTKLAGIKLATGYPNSWMPNPNGIAHLLRLENGNILVSGDFKTIGGVPKRHLALLDSVLGGAQPSMNVKVNGTISSKVELNGKIFLGGDFVSYGGEYRENIAAFDFITKEIKPWAPIVTKAGGACRVSEISVSNGLVYLGGYYDSINGQNRNYFGAVDTAAILTPFNPNLNSVVNRLLIYDDHIYIGGNFTSAGGVTRNGLASYDRASLTLDSWNPNSSNWVYDFKIVDSTLYVAGRFDSMGVLPRNRLAAVDIHSGIVKAWNPNVGGNDVRSIEVGNGQIYFGGEFNNVGGFTRTHLAAVDQFTGLINGWAPQTSLFTSGGVIYNIKLQGGIVYAHGDFLHAGSLNLARLAAFDAITGQPTRWLYNNSTNGPAGWAEGIGNSMFVGGGSSYFYKNSVSGFHVLPFAKSFTHYISGTLYNDSIVDCTKQTAEVGLSSLIVNILPDNSFVMSDHNGVYKLAFNDSVAYSVQPIIPQRLEILLDAPCPGNYNINMTSQDPTDSAGYDFGIEGHLCPVLRINISSNRRRRCTKSLTSITYTNEGLSDATGVNVHVKFPEFVIPLSSSDSFSWDMTDTTMVFNIGILQPGQSGWITIIDSVACILGITGLTQCTKAWITPINDCYNDLSATIAGWDHSSIYVSGICIPGTDTVQFKIKNNGIGNMVGTSTYRIYSNYIIQSDSNYTLIAGDSLLINYFSGGAALRMETEQMIGHPGNSHPSVSIEGCTISGPYSTGYISGMPEDDEGLELEISCLPILDSHDPNLKNVSPEGIGNYHIVSPGTLLDYRVHFQNTGNDTAYKVVVTDSISPYLDISTLELGAYSYPYTLSVSGTGSPILRFTFNGINLTDSTSDELHSQGFFDFKIAPKTSISNGTKIENFADIFFDFNPSVRTNTAWVTIDSLELTPAHLAQVTSQAVIKTSRCIGDSVSIEASFSGIELNYQWYKNNGLISGETDTILIIPHLLAADTGYYFCQASGFANTVSTDTIYLDNRSIPDVLNNLPDITVCESQQVNFSVLTTGGNIDFQWYHNGNISSSDTLDIINIPTAAPSDAGMYYCFISNDCGSDLSDSALVTVNNLNTPVITQNNDTLFSSGIFNSYQWLLNGVIIPGAVNPKYIYTSNGLYSIEVVDINGCSGVSNSLNITTSIYELTEQEISILPNPTSDYIIIESNDKPLERVCFYNIQGQRVIDLKISDRLKDKIALTGLSQGIYFMDCYIEGTVKRFKVIKN